MVLAWNTNLQPGMKAIALAIFLGRPPRSMLPNGYKQSMNIQEALTKRREEQDRISRKWGRYNQDEFEEGDPVVIQDPKTRTWKRKGKVIAKRVAADMTNFGEMVVTFTMRNTDSNYMITDMKNKVQIQYAEFSALKMLNSATQISINRTERSDQASVLDSLA